MRELRVLLADDHVMFAQALKNFLADEFERVETVADGQALVEMAQVTDPDVIVVDVSMTGMNGFDAVRQLKKNGTTARIIFLTMHADASLMAEAFRCGASGYVLKQSAGEELVYAIGEVMAGREYVTPLVARAMAQIADGGGIEPTSNLHLTPRQREVLQLIVNGMTMKEVASELGISARTAESHKYEMMQGLGVDTTAELIQYAIKLGLKSAL